MTRLGKTGHFPLRVLYDKKQSTVDEEEGIIRYAKILRICMDVPWGNICAERSRTAQCATLQQ